MTDEPHSIGTQAPQPPASSAVPLAGVVGWPVGHSRSPRLHGRWLRRYGMRGHYVPLAVAPEHLGQVLHSLPRAGFVGVNVTIPHKEAALALADVVTDRAALIGAANTLIFRPDGRIHADNTDGYGFIANLRQSAPDWQPDLAPAAVIGAGGAARAVVASLLETGVKELRIANRTRLRAEQIKAEFGARVVVYEWAQVGNMLEGVVHGADVQDRDGAPGLIERSCDAFPTLTKLFADGGYAGQKLEAAVAQIDRLNDRNHQALRPDGLCRSTTALGR